MHAHFVPAGAKDSATERYILWILTGVLGVGILCTILLVCFTVWRKLAKSNQASCQTIIMHFA